MQLRLLRGMFPSLTSLSGVSFRVSRHCDSWLMSAQQLSAEKSKYRAWEYLPGEMGINPRRMGINHPVTVYPPKTPEFVNDINGLRGVTD